MAKQAIVSAMEEVIGEYVLNIDTENLKVAALRGKIKLENVQLDGDLLGSYVLGSMGLSGFGILSCWAKSVKITVPLKNLEKEPTRIEMRGCHLLCVPLLPSTAGKMFGAGTASDPRCTLRTRAKRCKLARFEKNFMTGRIPDEGPVAKRILRAVKDVERDLKKRSKRRKAGSNNSRQQQQDEIDDDFSFNSLISDLGDTEGSDMSTTDRIGRESISGKESISGMESISSQDLPELPRDWKVKLREKMMRNMECSMVDIHMRCEVSEGGLDFCHPDNIHGIGGRKQQQKRRSHGGLKYDQRAFAFGNTLDRFVYRTANEKWEPGSHEKKPGTTATDQLGPNPYDARNNKLVSWENWSFYWDDDPAFIISDSEVVQSSDHKLSGDKFHGRIAAAMSALYHQQEPGPKIRESLQLSSSRRRVDRESKSRAYEERPHQYCFQGFQPVVRHRCSNRLEPGPISCQMEFMPFEWDIRLRPHQFVQYQKLKSAMLFQRRFDTMLRQRPSQSPTENPREWWKYAIGCVTTRPNSRSWQDVVRIGQNRSRYIDLVVKKVSHSEEYSGFHGGLSDSDFADLLELEDLLPLEALLAFHLVALRKATSPDVSKSKKESAENSPARGRRSGRTGFGRFFRSRSRSLRRDGENSVASASNKPPTAPTPTPSTPIGNTSLSLLDAMTVRLGRKIWMTNFKYLQGRITITLLTASDEEIVTQTIEASGTLRFFGKGKMDYYFDVTKFEAIESQQNRDGNGRGIGKILAIQGESEEPYGDDLFSDLSFAGSFPGVDTDACTSFIELPPSGVVCRLAAAREKGSTKFSFSSHPLTLMWTRPCFDAVAEFFGAPTSKMQTELTSHLKNAATPLARKAQLAFLSQSTLVLHCNVAAPKIWIPLVSQQGSDGALQLDAGNFRVSCSKRDGQPDLTWKMDASDIQMNFARWRLSEVRDRISSLGPFAVETLYASNQDVHSIIRPFQVHAENSLRQSEKLSPKLSDSLGRYTGVVSCVDISFSPICLNLVDAEVLARAIGKWYSQGLVSFRGRVSNRGSRSERSVALNSNSVGHATNDSQIIKKFQKNSGMPHVLSIAVAKFEMAIEGHSKTNFSDEKSIESHETSIVGEFAPSTRTYVFEVFNIMVHRVKHNFASTTKLLVADASVLQLKDPSEYFPMKDRHIADECQYSILEHCKTPHHDERTRGDMNRKGSPENTSNGSEVLVVSLFHDSSAHLDEVEVDIDSIILRVTPTSLKDCTKGIRKIVELVQLMTREMERKVHEEGRKARQKGRDGGSDECPSGHRRPVSPAWSVNSEPSEQQAPEESPVKLASDSSLLFKVTIRNGTLLAGRPTFGRQDTNSGTRLPRFRQSYSFAVVQVLSNALIMFQSIENPDSSGSKTLHASLDNLSASVNTAFDRIPPSKAPPMVGPTGTEFRVVHSTENFGCVVSSDISLDCEHLRSCLTPNDLSILVSIVNAMLERLKGVQTASPVTDEKVKRRKDGLVASLVKYKKSGTGIATTIRAEIQTFSFVVLRTFQSKFGAPELLSFDLSQLKAKLGGCMSALSGECTTEISVGFFNSDVSAWEHAVEPFPIKLVVDQMPNELILDLATDKSIQFNLTGLFLRDFSQLDFRLKKGKIGRPDALTPSALSTVGLRRATEAPSVVIHNYTGMDIDISLSGVLPPEVVGNSVRFHSIGPGVIKDKNFASLDSLLEDLESSSSFDEIVEKTRLSLKLPPTSTDLVGHREPVADLPILPTPGTRAALYILKPENLDESFFPSRMPFHPQGNESGRTSPETVLTDATRVVDFSYYHAEPVVEWCMQNQRLRSSIVDIYSLDKGKDMLSSSIWSPEEEYNVENINLTSSQSQDPLLDVPVDETHGEVQRHAVSSPTRKAGRTNPNKSNWLRPYLKNDSPEWTDMTCILRMARERVMLPDSTWMWVNDWSVDVSGEFGVSTDADGWEYQADFETFTRTRRFYNRGDACRRRRWTRTRIVKPPRLDDPSRLLKFVWETSRDEGGNFKIEVKSHVALHNATGTTLTFFAFSPSWDEEKHIGPSFPGTTMHMPVALASAVYLRLAKSKSSNPSTSIQDYVTTQKIMILPTSHNSNVWIRSSMKLDDVSETDLYFMVHIVCKKGIVDIFIGPVMEVLNLLPCQLECQLGEALRPLDNRQMDSRPVIASSKKTRIANVETLKVASGKEGKCIAVNPSSKPHISLRVPGYKWSAWQRIVNRRLDSYTWRPSESEEENFINWNKGDSDHAEDFQIMVRFERLGRSGDPLVLILSVECGLVPTVRVYSQYWVVDKTGFGCHFCESFTDLLGTTPDDDCSRRSHLVKEDARDPMIKRDMNSQGHEWSIGMSGMTLYFSLRERIALSIESGAGDSRYVEAATRSKWTSPMDISNVMPKTVFSVDELKGHRRFELAMSVTVCPGIFSRTRLITFIPRYQIVNLLKRELVVSQNGCLRAETLMPSQSSVPFHLEKQSLPPKVRLGAPTTEEKDCGDYDECWTNGCIQLDKVGITSMRLPTAGLIPTKPMVVQAEVRLASKDQDSAVVIVVWSTNEDSNPLYLLRNRTNCTVVCRQPLQDEQTDSEESIFKEACGSGGPAAAGQGSSQRFECGSEFGPVIRSFLGFDRIEEFVWVLRSGDVACFGFDDPEKPHILEWACLDSDVEEFLPNCKKAFVEIDAMGTTSSLAIDGVNEIWCQIGAEHSTKVIEFVEKPGTSSTSHFKKDSLQYQVLKEEGKANSFSEGDSNDDDEDDDEVAFSLRVDIPALSISVVDNADPTQHGREILMAQLENIFASFSQSREGYHELELRVLNLQVDNHVPSSIHPVLIFCPSVADKEPVLHMSAVRRLQQHSTTYVFRYAAFRLLEVNVFLDRRTAETIARFIEPVRTVDDATTITNETSGWASDLTIEMAMKYSHPDRRAPLDIETMVLTANSGRIYFEQLHLHPVRIALTFTQEWMELEQGNESLMVFQFIRGMASIADAPLTFTSFVVSHVFESPQALLRVIAVHYSSQLTKQIFGILGSLAILGAPADFISNVGTGVRDFFYEPIQGAVHGPRQFIEGLEAGTQSLARGVFVGVVRGAANVTEAVNANLAGLTADDDFIDERKAHQRMLTDAMSRGVTSRTFSDSLYLAGASIARGVRSGAYGIVEQPTRYASKHGPVGFVKGMGKAFVGAVVKPVVGVGDAATLIMNHVSDATSNKRVQAKIPKRLRRALPSISVNMPNCINLRPYDERAAKAQKIVNGGEDTDVYIGHVNIPSHLIIASDQCLWAIDRRSREPWCVSWEEISHFGRIEHGMRIVVFSQTGLRPYVFQVDDTQEANEIQKLLSMHLGKMGNAKSNLSEYNANEGLDVSLTNLPGVKSRQGKHVFGSCNQSRKRLASTIKDEIDLIEQCFSRVKRMGSESSTFFKTLDDEAWTLVSCWGQVFSGLSSRRCIVASVINGTGNAIQIKSTKLVEGGSPCYSIPTKEFDPVQGVLNAGGVIIFFGWGVVPSLLQAGNVFMHIETNAFIADLADEKNRDTFTEALPGYQVGFLEKSYDDAGWWGKYWLLIRKA